MTDKLFPVAQDSQAIILLSLSRHSCVDIESLYHFTSMHGKDERDFGLCCFIIKCHHDVRDDRARRHIACSVW